MGGGASHRRLFGLHLHRIALPRSKRSLGLARCVGRWRHGSVTGRILHLVGALAPDVVKTHGAFDHLERLQHQLIQEVKDGGLGLSDVHRVGQSSR